MSQTQPVKKVIIVNKGGVPFKKIPVVQEQPKVTEPIKPTVSNKYKIVIVNGVRKLVKTEETNAITIPEPIKPVAPKKTIIIVKKPVQPVVNEVVEDLPALEPITPDTIAQPIASLTEQQIVDVVKPLVEAPKADKELTVDQLLFRAIKGNRPDDVVKYIQMGGSIYYQNSDALENIAERGLVKVFQAIYTVTTIRKEIVEDCIEAAEEFNRKKVIEFLKTKL